jgi:protein-tyrosine phosphatase
MTPDREPGQSIPIPSVPNLRDLGDWPTRDGGRVRSGLVYRSTALASLAGADMSAFSDLGIRSVYDLRTPAESRAHPDQLPPGTEYVALDILEDSEDAAPAQLFAVATNPKAAEEMLGGGRGLALFETGYREIVSLPSALAGYRTLFSDMAQEPHRPALFHCSTGKDRTGWAAAALLMLLGVADDMVMKEYLLTNTELIPAEKPMLDNFRSLGGDPELLHPMVGVLPEYLGAALNEMRKKFGTVEGYFAEGLRIGSAEQEALREALVFRAT